MVKPETKAEIKRIICQAVQSVDVVFLRSAFRVLRSMFHVPRFEEFEEFEEFGKFGKFEG